MNKKIALFLILAGLFFVGKLVRGDSLFRNGREFTVLIGAHTLEGGIAGSGILLDRNHVLTCAHMIDPQHAEDQVFYIYTYPLGRVIRAKALVASMGDDIALLQLETPVPAQNFPKIQQKVEAGDAVTIVGNSNGCMQWLVTRGVISGVDQGYLIADAASHHGNSGGPWLNSKGELIGMTDWLLPTQDGNAISGGVSGHKIQRFLNNYARQQNMQTMLEKLLGGSR